MLLLILLSFISGLTTILTPCIWPVLPIIFSFSASSTGKSRPLGITTGIVVSFTILTLTLSLLVRSLGISPNIFRYVAVVVISFFGLSLIFPKLNQWMESRLSYFLRFTTKFKPERSNNFSSGFLTGLSLGALWTPCAGPILATVITLAAVGKITLSTVLVAFAYVVGVAVPLFLFSLGGQKLFSHFKFVSRATPKIQKFFGLTMIVTAILLFFNIDTLIQSTVLNRFPSLANITINPQNYQKNATLSSAPDFVGGTNWLNSPPLSLADLKGKVVLVDFWTYTCINCIRTLPHLTSWYDKYKDMGFVIIGVHTPEFEFEKDTNNVAKAIKNFGVSYPVVQDNNYSIWNGYQNQYWPAEYLIDKTGKIIHTHFGEGEYDQTEKLIQSLLSTNIPLDQKPDTSPSTQLSPETYLGANRAQFYYPNSSLSIGSKNFTLSPQLPRDSFSLGGTWNITGDQAVSSDNATLNYHFYASKVYLVLRPPVGIKGLVNVYLDGNLTSQIIVDTDRLYTLIDLGNKTEDHILKLEFLTPDTESYAFTFG